jgi:hypothetical protein
VKGVPGAVADPWDTSRIRHSVSNVLRERTLAVASAYEDSDNCCGARDGVRLFRLLPWIAALLPVGLWQVAILFGADNCVGTGVLREACFVVVSGSARRHTLPSPASRRRLHACGGYGGRL